MKRLWEILEPAKAGDRLSRASDVFILSLIAANVVAAIAGSVQGIWDRYGTLLGAFETASMAFFCVEYLLRLVTCVADPRFTSPIRGRIRFMTTPLAFLDLLVLLPFLLPLLVADLRCLRALRLVRILRVVRLASYGKAMRLFTDVFRAKREELFITTAVMVLLLIVSSSLMFEVEHAAQPEDFPSIPATMWWAVATLSTVGYGDIFPITPVGKLLGSVVAILGIAFFALPAGILGSGFVGEIERKKREAKCPHCGKSMEL